MPRDGHHAEPVMRGRWGMPQGEVITLATVPRNQGSSLRLVLQGQHVTLKCVRAKNPDQASDVPNPREKGFEVPDAKPGTLRTQQSKTQAGQPVPTVRAFTQTQYGPTLTFASQT